MQISFYKLLIAVLIAVFAVFYFRVEAARFKRIQTITGEPIFNKQMALLLSFAIAAVVVIAFLKKYRFI